MRAHCAASPTLPHNPGGHTLAARADTSDTTDGIDGVAERAARQFPAFPFTPYSIQQQFMTALYDTLQEGGVGILESPTGTVRTPRTASCKQTSCRPRVAFRGPVEAQGAQTLTHANARRARR